MISGRPHGDQVWDLFKLDPSTDLWTLLTSTSVIAGDQRIFTLDPAFRYFVRVFKPSTFTQVTTYEFRVFDLAYAPDHVEITKVYDHGDDRYDGFGSGRWNCIQEPVFEGLVTKNGNPVPNLAIQTSVSTNDGTVRRRLGLTGVDGTFTFGYYGTRGGISLRLPDTGYDPEDIYYDRNFSTNFGGVNIETTTQNGTVNMTQLRQWQNCVGPNPNQCWYP